MRISDWSSDVCSSDLIAAAKDAQKIVLDDNGLIIKGITDANGAALSYEVGPRDAIHGAPLTIRLGGARRIVIAYESAPDAKAVQWMAPEQTLGKQKPYLFTQGEAILNRTWIPTQDSRSEEHTSELQSLMRISYAVFCLQKKNHTSPALIPYS